MTERDPWNTHWDSVPTGELRLYLARGDSRYTVRTWKDGVRLKLEDQVKGILIGLLDESAAIKVEREKQRLAEIERKREEKVRNEQSARREANAKLVRQLESQAGAWFRARFLRAYVRALERALGPQHLTANRGKETVDFVEWARHYIDQLDPLCVTAHDQDHMPDREPYYILQEEKLNETIGRLLGQKWEEAFKIGPENDPDTDS